MQVEQIEELLFQLTGSQNLPMQHKHPDLLVRTGGEHRLSNFMLWDVAYSELHFSDVMWPAFSSLDFLHALEDYSQRQRTFGKRL